MAERYARLSDLQSRISTEENMALVGKRVEVLVAEGEGRKDGVTRRLSGRARDNRLVHFAVPKGADEPRPGDMVEVDVTYGAPSHLLADSGLEDGGTYSVRATAAGDAWQRRQDSREERLNAVNLGIPLVRPNA